jgi:hypothetical protein
MNRSQSDLLETVCIVMWLMLLFLAVHLKLLWNKFQG